MFSIRKSLFTISFLICALLFWLVIVCFLGVSEATSLKRSGVLSNTYNWWANASLQEHYFLGMYSNEHISNHLAYTTYTIPFNLFFFTILYPLHVLLREPYESIQNITVYINLSFLLLLIWRVRKQEIIQQIQSNNLFDKGLLFLLIGLITTNALPWISLLRYNAENPHMIAILLFCYLSLSIYQDTDEPTKDKRFFICGILLSCLSPNYFPAWMLSYLIQENKLSFRKKLVKNLAWVFIVPLINYTLPLILCNLAGYKSAASGFLYRSGLDGSDRYFQSNLGAIFHPVSEQHIANDLILIAIIIITGYYTEKKKQYFKQALALLIPFLTIVILFPQFTSIHMYMVEFLLVIPCIFLLAYHFFEVKKNFIQSPTKYIYIGFIFSFLIMGQLIEIARAFEWFKHNL